jgi:hypothetical protein
MNLILNRTKYCSDGIFGELLNDSGGFICCTLEHAFMTENGTYKAKVAAGEYLCKVGTGPLKNGMHALHDGVPFVAYQIQNVPPFQGKPVANILFHQGNFQNDSDGCVLLGKQMEHEEGGRFMLIESKIALSDFMKMQNLDDFTIKINDKGQ